MEENKLDKNQIIGFVVIGILLLVFNWYTSNNTDLPQEPETQQTEQVIEASPEAPEVVEAPVVAVEEKDSTQASIDSANAYMASQSYTLENDLVKIVFTGKGAQIESAELKEYQTFDSLPLYLVNENALFNFNFGQLNTADLLYNGTVEETENGKKLSLTAQTAQGTLSFWYLLPNDDYMMQAGISGNGLALAEGSNVTMQFAQDAFSTEKSKDNEKNQTTIYYWTEGDFDYLSLRSEDEEQEKNVEWVGHKQQFFSTIITPEVPFTQADMGSVVLEEAGFSKRMVTRATLGQKAGNQFSTTFTMFFGPNQYHILKDYDKGYDKIIDFGWGIFGWISRYVVVFVFNWLEAYGLNYGLIILIMAILIKLVLSPLTYQSYKSMAKMRVLKPEIDELNEKYKDADPMKKQQETMGLYREAGVNPLGGCIPQLVQMPILIAMFRFFPASIELRQQPFLWATDLSTYDDLIRFGMEIPFLGSHISIFTLLMTISMFIYTSMNNSMTGANAQMPQMKYVMYAMPIMMFFFFNSYASGLSYYYFIANILTFGQQWLIRKTMDEDAIHAKLQANKANPKKKKKSKFQQQLEEMSKQQGRRGQRQAKK